MASTLLRGTSVPLPGGGMLSVSFPISDTFMPNMNMLFFVSSLLLLSIIMATREYRLRKHYEKQLAKHLSVENNWEKPQLSIPDSPTDSGLRHRNIAVSPV